MTSPGFFRGYAQVARVLSGLFILFQIASIVDFSCGFRLQAIGGCLSIELTPENQFLPFFFFFWQTKRETCFSIGLPRQRPNLRTSKPLADLRLRGEAMGPQR